MHVDHSPYYVTQYERVNVVKCKRCKKPCDGTLLFLCPACFNEFEQRVDRRIHGPIESDEFKKRLGDFKREAKGEKLPLVSI